MSNKLATAFVCIGIAVGSLGAPKAHKPNPAAMTTQGAVTPLSSVVEDPPALDVGVLHHVETATNTFGVVLQQ